MLQGEKRDTRDRLRQSHDDSQKTILNGLVQFVKSDFFVGLQTPPMLNSASCR
jgi:hypothetical protein